jgi:hypothetical protein
VTQEQEKEPEQEQKQEGEKQEQEQEAEKLQQQKILPITHNLCFEIHDALTAVCHRFSVTDNATILTLLSNF